MVLVAFFLVVRQVDIWILKIIVSTLGLDSQIPVRLNLFLVMLSVPSFGCLYRRLTVLLALLRGKLSD